MIPFLGTNWVSLAKGTFDKGTTRLGFMVLERRTSPVSSVENYDSLTADVLSFTPLLLRTSWIMNPRSAEINLLPFFSHVVLGNGYRPTQRLPFLKPDLS